ncbi:MAG: hypothetical protein M0R03_08010 [Novosphingobium sp.]|nr:hypothetical protein [Novosphingobium sp.]
MIARAGSGWQIILADLSLILFMTTAAALSTAPDGAPRQARPPSARSEPLAVWRAEAGAPAPDAWLAEQSADPRQQLTVAARYAPGGQGSALEQAARLARQAGAHGLRARIVVEPGEPGLSATLAYDSPEPLMENDR